MNSAKTQKDALDSADKFHPFILKMGGNQWLIGDSAIPNDVSELNPQAVEDNTERLHEQAHTPSVMSPVVRPLMKYFSWVLDKVMFLHEAAEANQDQTHQNGRRDRLSKSKRRFQSAVSRSIQDTFQLGLTFGLVLGCLSLILFHQLNVSYPPQVSQTTNYRGLSSANSSFLVPATHLFVQAVGPFAKAADATPILQRLDQDKHAGVLVEEKGHYYIWGQLSVHPGSIKPLQLPSMPHSVQSKIIPAGWHPTAVPALRDAPVSTLSATSTWLDTSVSAITALIAVESDGARPQDAMTAYRTSKSHRPSAQILKETGYSGRFNQYQQSVDRAFQSYNQHNYVSSMKSLSHALAILQNLTYKGS